MKTDLKGLDARETEEWVLKQGLKPYRARQIRHWLFKRLALSFDQMTDISKPQRAQLEQNANITPLEQLATLTSQDGTRKYLFKLSDDHVIESVLIPEREHLTLCISSQAGCSMGCRFCLTGARGLSRNLSAGEIIEQVIQVKQSIDQNEELTNIVFMGMGEPLANYGPVLKAIGNLTSEEGMNFSHRKITLSTCGIVPQITNLGRDAKVNLAVSLNAADNDTRSLLMPINKKYPIEALLWACNDFPLPNGRRITFEYILIKDINDQIEDANRLCKLLSRHRSKINLIPLNPHPGMDLSPPSMGRVLRFQEILLQKDLTATIRKSKGGDICAACGQLTGQYPYTGKDALGVLG